MLQEKFEAVVIFFFSEHQIKGRGGVNKQMNEWMNNSINTLIIADRARNCMNLKKIKKKQIITHIRFVLRCFVLSCITVATESPGVIYISETQLLITELKSLRMVLVYFWDRGFCSHPVLLSRELCVWVCVCSELPHGEHTHNSEVKNMQNFPFPPPTWCRSSSEVIQLVTVCVSWVCVRVELQFTLHNHTHKHTHG